MLVKAGEKIKAKKIYKWQKLPKDSYWSYKDILENRIKNIDKNVELFRRPSNSLWNDKELMMFNGSFSCMACHQK